MVSGVFFVVDERFVMCGAMRGYILKENRIDSLGFDG